MIGFRSGLLGSRRTLGAAMLAFAACGAQEAPTPQTAQTALDTGQYEDAIRAFEQLADSVPDVAVPGLNRALLATGAYDRILELPADRTRPFWQAEALYRMGQVDQAAQRYEESVDEDGAQRLTAELRLAEIAWDRGQREDALTRFDAFFDHYNQGRAQTPEELLAVGQAVYRLSITNSELAQDALRAMDEAASLEVGPGAPDIALGNLFLDKYQSGDARAEFEKVLAVNPRHPDALVGMARALAFDHQPGGTELLEQALEVNPKHVGALLALGRARLESEDRDAAREFAERAIEANPSSLEARSLAAVADLLDGDDAAFERRADAILSDNPTYAELFSEAARLATTQRWYAQAAELALRGARVDSLHAPSWGELGLNQLRTGQIEEGRASLTRAFELDPSNVWYFNTLELADTFERFRHVRSDNFDFVLYQDEADLLGPYFVDVGERALRELQVRYGAPPELPMRVEVYPNHADFSVRTVGLAGLGALGVSFGPVLAMDSPSARGAGDFNWASTLWHEIAHSFHLAISEHRVPRWFTEGLAMWEQRRAEPGWGHALTPLFLNVYRDGGLRPVSQLNEGFVRPRFPEEVPLSYFLGSLVLERIEGEYGFDAVLGFLHGYRDGLDTPAIFRQVLGVEPEDFDDSFDAWVRDRFSTAFASTDGITGLPSAEPPADSTEQVRAVRQVNPDSFMGQLRQGIAAFEAGDRATALPLLERADELFPEYGGPDSPLWYLGRLHEQMGQLELAEQRLSRLLTLSEHHLEGAQALADVRARLGDLAGASDALGRVIEINPFQAETHRTRAEWLEEQERWDEAVLERAALAALDPVDRAEALYSWAVALHRAGRSDEARTRVVEALEIAPGYDAALDLLLELRGGGT